MPCIRTNKRKVLDKDMCSVQCVTPFSAKTTVSVKCVIQLCVHRVPLAPHGNMGKPSGGDQAPGVSSEYLPCGRGTALFSFPRTTRVLWVHGSDCSSPPPPKEVCRSISLLRCWWVMDATSWEAKHWQKHVCPDLFETIANEFAPP